MLAAILAAGLALAVWRHARGHGQRARRGLARSGLLIAALASAPTKAIADQGSITEQTQGDGDPQSCAALTANMRANYQDLYLSGPASLGAPCRW